MSDDTRRFDDWKFVNNNGEVVGEPKDPTGWYPIGPTTHDMRLEFEDSGALGGPEDVWFTVNHEAGWRFRLRIEASDDGYQIVEGPNFVPPAGEQPTTTYLRTIGLGAVDDAIQAWLRDPWVVANLGGRWVGLARRRPGRRGRPLEFYAEWAKRYTDALHEAPRTPVKYLVDEEAAAGRHVTAGQVRAYLNKARVEQLLTGSPEGRAGGELTQKARELLRQAFKEGDVDGERPEAP